MNDLSKSGDLPKQTTRYPKLDADPNIGPIRYVLIHKALMPESKVSQKGAISLQISTRFVIWPALRSNGSDSLPTIR